MSEINEKIAKWLGYEVNGYIWRTGPDASWNSFELPDYKHSDAYAVELLNVLVKRTHEGWHLIPLHRDKWEWICLPWYEAEDACHTPLELRHPTIAAAICAAVIQLIEREKGE